MKCALKIILLVIVTVAMGRTANSAPLMVERMFEQSFVSEKSYADPFNDVDVDVVFTGAGGTWRVPAFWSGGQSWTVRFAPNRPGRYRYHLESSDQSNPDLNGQSDAITIIKYRGTNPLLRHGNLKVSANKRFFEHADGTPFYWLGDTWWTGLSTRLDWDGFQRLLADRKEKGYTVIQTVAGLVPPEERPFSPGFCNEGGCVWDSGFKTINPRYFEYADRRITAIVDAGLVPAIVGSWGPLLADLGVQKMKKHWRYIVARYGAYPGFWIVGGEVLDPPEDIARSYPAPYQAILRPGWTEVAAYVRSIDPYRHPLTVHEAPPPQDAAIRDENLTDFDMFQPGHGGWRDVGTAVEQLGIHYSRTKIVKPLIVGEVNYEGLGGTLPAEMQRSAFWLSMLNGAAGFTYGADGLFESYSAELPLHWTTWSLTSWQEGMQLPGARQIAYSANLLKTFQWWNFTPRPEWVSPRGTTFLAPTAAAPDSATPIRHKAIAGWFDPRGNFFLPYAAGDPRGSRLIYFPYHQFYTGEETPTPTIQNLEPATKYHAYYWDPRTGTKFDLGTIGSPPPGETIYKGNPRGRDANAFDENAGVTTLRGFEASTLRASGKFVGNSDAGLVVLKANPDDRLEIVFDRGGQRLVIQKRYEGEDRTPIAEVFVGDLGKEVTLTVEIGESNAIASISDGVSRYSTPIVDIERSGKVGIGLLFGAACDNLIIRNNRPLLLDENLDKRLVDAEGRNRGMWAGGDTGQFKGRVTMDDYGKKKILMLNAYRPERPPFPQDWVLVLDKMKQ